MAVNKTSNPLNKRKSSISEAINRGSTPGIQEGYGEVVSKEPKSRSINPLTSELPTSTILPTREHTSEIPSREQAKDRATILGVEKELKKDVARLGSGSSVDSIVNTMKPQFDSLPKSSKSQMESIRKELETKRDKANEAYKKSKNLNAWLAAAETLTNAFIQLGAGAYGMKHGIDMSGAKFIKTDWQSKIDTLGKELDRNISSIDKEEASRTRQEERRQAKEIKSIDDKRRQLERVQDLKVSEAQQRTDAYNRQVLQDQRSAHSSSEAEKAAIRSEELQDKRIKASELAADIAYGRQKESRRDKFQNDNFMQNQRLAYDSLKQSDRFSHEKDMQGDRVKAAEIAAELAGNRRLTELDIKLGASALENEKKYFRDRDMQERNIKAKESSQGKSFAHDKELQRERLDASSDRQNKENQIRLLLQDRKVTMDLQRDIKKAKEASSNAADKAAARKAEKELKAMADIYSEKNKALENEIKEGEKGLALIRAGEKTKKIKSSLPSYAGAVEGSAGWFDPDLSDLLGQEVAHKKQLLKARKVQEYKLRMGGGNATVQKSEESIPNEIKNAKPGQVLKFQDGFNYKLKVGGSGQTLTDWERVE